MGLFINDTAVLLSSDLAGDLPRPFSMSEGSVETGFLRETLRNDVAIA
jgi:hypothetical protein